jgi:Uma2 family endonuclease
MASTATTEPTLTATEFLARYGDRSGVELVRGRVVWADDRTEAEAGMPKFRHGVVSNRIAHLLTTFVESRGLGWVAGNDTFVQTEHALDTVRGADVLFVSYQRVPKRDTIPEDLSQPPELVVEVLSPTNRQGDMLKKVGEYLNAGVLVVLVVDPETECVSLFRQNELPQRFHNGDELTMPDVLPGFSVRVKQLFS